MLQSDHFSITGVRSILFYIKISFKDIIGGGSETVSIVVAADINRSQSLLMISFILPSNMK